jgi:site-specific DNA recombinase
MAPNPLGREDGRKGNTMGQAERSEARQSCIIYSRVSSDEQAKGYSLTTQEESCRRYCVDHGYAIVGAFHDAHSGTELDRPGLNAAIEAVDALKPTVVLLHDVDRLGREIIVQAIAERDLTRHGARIEYVLGGGNATPEQELLKMMKQGIAVYENRQRVERSRRGKDGRVRAGGVLVAARPAYGYRYVSADYTGTLEPHPDEAPVVRSIFAWCVEERLSCYAIAKRLCETGRPSRADSDTGIVRKRAPHHTWNPHTVAKMLRNETYMGVWHWGKTRRVKRGDRIVQEPRPREEWLSLPVTPLVDEATWQRAQVQLGHNKSNARTTDREYLSRGLIFCSSCGRRWYARYKRDIDRCYYRCPNTRAELWAPSDCTIRFSFEQTRLESAVLDAIKAFLLDPETRTAGVAAEQERLAAERQRLGDDLVAIDRHLAATDQRLGKLLDDALSDGFPATLIEQRKRDLLAERERRIAERADALARLAATDVPDLEAAIAALAPTVERAFAAATSAELRQLLEVLRVEIHPIDRNEVRLTGVIGGADGSIVTLSR